MTTWTINGLEEAPPGAIPTNPCGSLRAHELHGWIEVRSPAQWSEVPGVVHVDTPFILVRHLCQGAR